jgi:hypothetical protein
MAPGTGPREPGTSHTVRGPASPADLPDHDHQGARSDDDGDIRPRKMLPWRPIGAVATSIGAPAGIGLLHPILGAAVFLVELALSVMILSTALFGTREYSERAFRLLRWIADRPEPEAPPGSSGPGPASSYRTTPQSGTGPCVSADASLITVTAVGQDAVLEIPPGTPERAAS